MEKKKRHKGHIGLDRIVLKAIDINHVNVKLMRKSFLIQEDGEYFRIMIDGAGEGQIKVSYIKIKSSDELGLKLNELNIGAKKINNQLIPYEYLDATLPSLLDERGLNVNNVKDVESFIKSLEILEKELKGLGFGTVDLKKAQIEELELNINIPLAGEFGDYERPLKYLKELLPRTLKKEQEYRNRVTGAYTGFKCFNGSISFKVYDKRAQVLEEHKEDIEEELLRLEYRLLSGEKVKGFLGHNEVSNIIQDFDQIERNFRERLEKDLIKKLDKDIKDQIKNTIKTLKDYKKKYKSKYIAQAVGALGENSLLDYEILKRAFELVEEGKNKSTLKNNLTLIRKKLREKEELNNIDYFNNITKINEILIALGYAKIVLK